MLFIRIYNHGLAPEDLDPRRGAKLGVIAKHIKSACKEVLATCQGAKADPDDTVIDMPFDATLGGGEKSALVVLADILTWPTSLTDPDQVFGEAVMNAKREQLRRDLADAIGESLAKYYTSGRALCIAVRAPDPRNTSIWSR